MTILASLCCIHGCCCFEIAQGIKREQFNSSTKNISFDLNDTGEWETRTTMGCIISRKHDETSVIPRWFPHRANSSATVVAATATATAESEIWMTMHRVPVVSSYPTLDSTDRFKYMTMQYFIIHICFDGGFPWIPDPREVWLSWKNETCERPMDWDVAALALESDAVDVWEFLPLSKNSPLPSNRYFLNRLSIRVHEKLLAHYKFQFLVQSIVRHSIGTMLVTKLSSQQRERDVDDHSRNYGSIGNHHLVGSCGGRRPSWCFLGILNVPDILNLIGSYAGGLTHSQLVLIEETVSQIG